MDLSYLQVMQMIMIFLIVYAVSYLILPVIKHQYVLAATTVKRIQCFYFFHFDLHIRRCDYEAFEKYEIWRFIQKRRADSIAAC